MQPTGFDARSTAYGDAVADVYDETVDAYPYLDTSKECAILSALADGGRALELGVGTGRLAIPLALAGTDVTGLDVSEPMLAVLRAKPGADRVTTVLGSMAEIPDAVGTDFALVYSVFQSFFCLLSQREQVACFAEASRRLAPRGRFVVEGFVPPVAEFRDGQRLRVAGMGDRSVNLTVSSHDPVTQRMSSRLVFVADDSIRVVPWEIRYAWPSELDLMSSIAGLELEARWQDWDRSPFTATSTRHVSVYRATGA